AAVAGREGRHRRAAVQRVAADEVRWPVQQAEVALAPGVDLALDLEAAERGHGHADVAVHRVGLPGGGGSVQDLPDLPVPDQVDDLQGQVGLDVEAGAARARAGDAGTLQRPAGHRPDHAVTGQPVDLLEGHHRVVGLRA